MHSCSAEEAAALAAAASKRFDASSDARSEVTTCGMPEAVLGERPEDGDERSFGGWTAVVVCVSACVYMCVRVCRGFYGKPYKGKRILMEL